MYRKLDSIKQTRRPNDSYVKVLFDKDIDFGYKHQRIDVTYNRIYYQVNLIVKNDSICFSSVLFDSDFYEKAFNTFKAIKIEPVVCFHYLKLRNDFYQSSTSISDIRDDLDMTEDYAFYCGDGSPKTQKGKYIEDLAKNHKVNKLLKLLGSLNWEEQAYGYAGFTILQKSGYEMPSEVKKIMKHIKKRNSELLTCSGCFAHQLKKGYAL